MAKSEFKVKAKVWLYQGASAWHFITLPKKESEEIKKSFAGIKRGWGSIPVAVTIGKTMWSTSIFPDAKAGAYLLPIKFNIRKKEGITAGDMVSFSIKINV